MSTTRDDDSLITRFCETRDSELREELILRYVPLVHFVLGRLGISRSVSTDYEDLASQGLLGLIEAADRFDPAFGTQFSTYATLRIRGKILDHLRDQDWLSRTARRRSQTVQQAINTLWMDQGRSPSEQEIADFLHVDLENVQQALSDSTRVIVSLDSFLESGDDGDSSLHETLGDDNQPDPADQLDESDLKQQLIDALQELPERDRLVLSLYYYEELTLSEIGEVIGVSESRVCQLHSRAVMNLRALLSQSGGKAIPVKLPRSSRRNNQLSDVATDR